MAVVGQEIFKCFVSVHTLDNGIRDKVDEEHSDGLVVACLDLKHERKEFHWTM